MGRNKAVGPDQIPVEAWRCLGDMGISLLTSLFNKIWTSAKMPEEWRLSEVIPIYKNKGDVQSCSNYRGIKLKELPWCMIFADDIALIARSTEELNSRLEKWREALEDNGLCVSREKNEYLRCDFDKQEIRQNGDEDIRIGERILDPKVSFRYVGSVIHKSGRIDEDVTHRIQAGWMRWRAASGVICDKRIPLKLKGKFYRVAIRPAMLYTSEYWPMTKAQASRVEVVEMRMLRWSSGKTLSDRIPTRVFRADLEVGTIISKLREGRFRWFDHVRRRDRIAPLKRAESIHVEGIRRWRRPMMRWEDRLAKDLIELGLSEDMTSDRKARRTRIRVED
uniref:uncharacterized protein LOC122587864 n=1 Tax=Erigeron canadensis TaxID=72917 RepID=UPI001CB92425|nr:uncharacterized protein LOC122587864 [Erigeron canadensis]